MNLKEELQTIRPASNKDRTYFMAVLRKARLLRHRLFIALPLALCLFFLFPAISLAHAVLLRSDPAQDAVLNTAPSQVRMWFSEDLNPTFSTAAVVNGRNQRVDLHNAHVSPDNPQEMDISLQANLPPAVYVVIWRTQSADDGHILVGSFIFSVAEPDGTVPKLSGGVVPGQNILGSSSFSSGSSSGQLDGPAFFSFIMVTLVDLGVVFWVGAQLWRTFVSQLTDTEDQEQLMIERQTEYRFERFFALPTLLVLLLANVGVLVGQALSLTGGNPGQALSPALLSGLVADGHFGTYWIMREIVIILAIIVAAYTVLFKGRAQSIDSLITWLNLLLGLALLIAVTLSGHAAAASPDLLIYAVLVDWLHLLAASLWIGGMLFIALIYLPVLKGRSLSERAGSLLTVLPRFSPLAITGVIIMAVSGPFNAAVHMTSIEQVIATAYGRTLVVKALLVGLLLFTSAIHVGLYRPRLAKDYRKYALARDDGPRGETSEAEQSERPIHRTDEVKQLEAQVARQTRRLTSTLRWEPLLGVGVLLCTGLLNVFGGTLQPPAPPAPPAPAKPHPFVATVKTSDNKFSIDLNVNPNTFGTNVFTVTVRDAATGKVDTNVGVSVYTTMLDMDMGTQANNLQPDGKGHFSAQGDLSMPGRWQLRIEIRTPDNTLHEAKVDMLTPS